MQEESDLSSIQDVWDAHRPGSGFCIATDSFSHICAHAFNFSFTSLSAKHHYFFGRVNELIACKLF